MVNKYYSHGKILLSGEYLVLLGALALAFPVRLGQWMQIEQLDSEQAILIWESQERKKVWFKACFSWPELSILESTSSKVAQRLQSILQSIMQNKCSHRAFPEILRDLKIKTNLEFNRYWGFGSSSTLIANLCQWSGANPYQILAETFGGSGYDIACAQAKGPIFFRLSEGRPVVKTISFRPEFISQLYLVYLNVKQNSQLEVQKFKTGVVGDPSSLAEISHISRQLAKSSSLEKFNELLELHETILGRILHRPTLRQEKFPDYFGMVKSLGAWGGDFFLATCPFENTRQEVEDYFFQKGMDTILPLKDLLYDEIAEIQPGVG